MTEGLTPDGISGQSRDLNSNPLKTWLDDLDLNENHDLRAAILRAMKALGAARKVAVDSTKHIVKAWRYKEENTGKQVICIVIEERPLPKKKR